MKSPALQQRTSLAALMLLCLVVVILPLTLIGASLNCRPCRNIRNGQIDFAAYVEQMRASGDDAHASRAVEAMPSLEGVP